MVTKTRAAVIFGFDRLVEELGGDPMKVANEAGLNFADISGPDHPLSSTLVKNVMDLAARETGCAHFGLLLAESRDLASYLGLVGRIVQTAPTLGAALEEAFKLMSLHSEVSLWQLHRSDEICHITYSMLEGAEGGTEQVQMFVISNFWRFVHAMTLHAWHPTMISFTFKELQDPSALHRAFDVPILFEGDFCGVVFHARDLDIELAGQDPNLHETLRRYAEEVASRKPRRFDDQVRMLIRKNLEVNKIGESTITQFLPFEMRTLQRKLKREGTSYRQLLNEVRVEMAKELLTHSDIPMTRLAERLGYSQLATMTRAFKSQTGTSPSTWRKQTR
jgi:AraC-like DNA-binding protein